MGKAAQCLHTSQSAVSRSISILEATLGVVLLARTPHGIEPTPYGRSLTETAGSAFDGLRRGIQHIGLMSDPAGGAGPSTWTGRCSGKRIRPPKQRRLPVVLSDTQVRALLARVRNPVHKTCLPIMYGCGLRITCVWRPACRAGSAPGCPAPSRSGPPRATASASRPRSSAPARQGAICRRQRAACGGSGWQPLPELQRPLAHGFMADDAAARGQQLIHHSQAQ